LVIFDYPDALGRLPKLEVRNAELAADLEETRSQAARLIIDPQLRNRVQLSQVVNPSRVIPVHWLG